MEEIFKVLIPLAIILISLSGSFTKKKPTTPMPNGYDPHRRVPPPPQQSPEQYFGTLQEDTFSNDSPYYVEEPKVPLPKKDNTQKKIKVKQAQSPKSGYAIEGEELAAYSIDANSNLPEKNEWRKAIIAHEILKRKF